MVLCIKFETVKSMICYFWYFQSHSSMTHLQLFICLHCFLFHFDYFPLAKLVAMLLSGIKMHVTGSCVCGVCTMTGCADGQMQK